jgi:dihydrofolate reductase
VNLIVAVDDNWGIGRDGTQSVIIPEDRKRFRELTDGGTVIVGHKTLLDFPGGKPLAGRKNIVMSRNKDLKIEGATVVSTPEELFAAVGSLDPEKVFVIGGGHIFKMLLPYCRYAFVTKIKAEPESDAFFPNLDAYKSWVLEDAGVWKTYNGIGYAFQKYKNTAPLNYKQK